MADADWREAIEWALGIEPDPENHTPSWCAETVREIREIGNARHVEQPAETEEQSFDAVSRAKELGIDVESHRCTCEPCLHTSVLCTASLSSLLLAIEEAERPHVCPGCHAVAERCLPGCIDDEIERDRQDALMRGDYDASDEETDNAD